MSEDWNEKYRPKTLDDVIGNPSAAETMRAWARSWEHGIPEKRVMLLKGAPGIGKTSSAWALAREMGWPVVEMNASDQRKAEDIRNIALRASHFDTFSDDGSFSAVRNGGMKMIILDEADSFSPSGDRGALPAISELIKTTEQPTVMIVNDFYNISRRSSAVKDNTLQVDFKKPRASAVEKVLARICESEGVDAEPAALAAIAANADGDLRAAVRDLESLAYSGAKVTAESAHALSMRQAAGTKSMYDFIGAVFTKRDPALAYSVLRDVDSDPGTVSVWLDENIPYQISDTGELVRCYENLSRADIYLGRVSRRMYYGFWGYANNLMVDGIIGSRRSKPKWTRINWPSYLTKMSRTKSVRTVRNSLAAKIGRLTHTSAARILADSLPSYRMMAKNDQEFRVMLVKDGGLDEDELAFLLGAKVDSAAVKKAFLEAFPPEEKPVKKTRAKKAPQEPAVTAAAAAAAPAAEEHHASPEAPAEKKEPARETAPQAAPEAPAKPAKKVQMSLFDF